MLKQSLLFITLLGAVSATGQDIAELERRNGFKDLKLGTPIDSVNGEKKLKKEFLERNEFAAKLYAISHPNYESIGEIPVEKVEVKTYQDLIYQIIVVTDKDPRLMKALESIYGPASYDMKKKTYFWKGNTLLLTFQSHARNQLVLTFTSYTVMQRMKNDKEKKVENIAEDF